MKMTKREKKNNQATGHLESGQLLIWHWSLSQVMQMCCRREVQEERGAHEERAGERKGEREEERGVCVRSMRLRLMHCE